MSRCVHLQCKPLQKSFTKRLPCLFLQCRYLTPPLLNDEGQRFKHAKDQWEFYIKNLIINYFKKMPNMTCFAWLILTANLNKPHNVNFHCIYPLLILNWTLHVIMYNCFDIQTKFLSILTISSSLLRCKSFLGFFSHSKWNITLNIVLDLDWPVM